MKIFPINQKDLKKKNSYPITDINNKKIITIGENGYGAVSD